MTFIEETQQWRKFTKWNATGYTVEMVAGNPLFLPATPLQYLRRLRLHNQIFGDAVRLIGIQRRNNDLRLVTEQPHIVGAAPEWDEMDELLCVQQACRRLQIPPMGHYKSYSYLRGAVGVFDVHPGNCVIAATQALVPIDFILVEFASSDLDAMTSRLI